MRTILARDQGHFSLREYKDGHALCSLGVFWDAQYSPDGKQIAAAVQDGKLFSAQVWDVHTCQLKLKIPVGQRILMALSYSGNGKTLVGSATGSTAIVWAAKTGMVMHEIGTTTARQVNAAILNHDGTRLLTKWQPATLDQEFVSLWDVETGKELHRFLEYDEQRPGDRNHSTGVIGFSPDGTVIPVASDGKLLGLWSAATGQLIQSFQ